MKVDEIKLLYDYNDWADARILAACARVSPEQYAAPSSCGTGRGGLRATMVHMLDNIWQWRITLQGYYKEPLADQAAYEATELHAVSKDQITKKLRDPSCVFVDGTRL